MSYQTLQISCHHIKNLFHTGRKEIITHYLGKILSKDINVDVLARGTTGFTGADIENMVNQAALKAAIEGAEVVTMRHVENARDKVLMGPERKARIPDEEANKITAYHEGGHAIVAYFTKVVKKILLRLLFIISNVNVPIFFLQKIFFKYILNSIIKQ